jgi:phosphate transport system substrate-binding protein
MLKDNKKSQTGKKNILQKNVLLPTIVGAFVVGSTFAYALFRSCSWGEYKANLFFCNSYQSFKDVQIEVSGQFTYGGSTALINLGKQFENGISAVREDFSVISKNIRSDSQAEIIAWSGEAIRQLIGGELDIAFSSRDLTPEEKDTASQKGFHLEAIPVAMDGLAFFVNKDQEIDSLSLEEIVDIYTGKKLNWEEFQSSQNLQINAFSPDPTDNQGLPEYFQKEVMQNQPFASDIQTGNPSKVMNDVATNRGGIGFASASLFCPQETLAAKPLHIEQDGGSFSPCEGNRFNEVAIANGTYPLARKLFVIIRRDGTNREKAGIAYVNMLLSDEGQKFVRDARYVPIQ